MNTSLDRMPSKRQRTTFHNDARNDRMMPYVPPTHRVLPPAVPASNKMVPSHHQRLSSHMVPPNMPSRMASVNQWKHVRQSSKIQQAIEDLDKFKREHAGKLPSLRKVMKMFKVGFPKAHEILEHYAKHLGVSVKCLIYI